MESWITWIIQAVAYGLICFLLKRELNRMDQRDKDTRERIEALEEKINTTINNLPFQYTLRDDFIRAVAGMENKLDKILDQLSRRPQ